MRLYYACSSVNTAQKAGFEESIREAVLFINELMTFGMCLSLSHLSETVTVREIRDHDIGSLSGWVGVALIGRSTTATPTILAPPLPGSM